MQFFEYALGEEDIDDCATEVHRRTGCSDVKIR